MCVLSKIISSIYNIGRKLQYMILNKRTQSHVITKLTKIIYDVVEGK